MISVSFINAGGYSIASVVKKLKRNAFLVGNENFLLVNDDGEKGDEGRCEEVEDTEFEEQ